MPRTKPASKDEETVSPTLVRLASGLAAAAILSETDEGAAVEHIGPFLNKVYALSADLQSDVVDQAMGMLLDQGEPMAEGWLLDELEFQAQIRDVSPKDGHLNAILFAVPVMLAGDLVPTELSATEVTELEGVLLDCEVISSTSRVQLAPALYTVSQLMNLSWGDVARLAEGAAEGDLAGSAFAWAPHASADIDDDQDVKLRYMLGVLLTAERKPENAFPELEAADSDEEDDSEDELSEAFGFVRAGFSATGAPWEDLFKEALERACDLEVSVLATAAPEGFYFDIAAGLREWRGLVMRVGFDAQLERRDLLASALFYEVQPGIRPEEGNTRFLVNLYQVEMDEPCLQMEWFSLPEEPDFVALGELVSALTSMKLQPKTAYSAQGIFYLH